MKVSQTEFERRVFEANIPNLDISETRYVGALAPVEVRCTIHGPWKTIPHNLYRGHGCDQCAMIVRANKRRIPSEKFFERLRSVHGDTYDYSATQYTSMHHKIAVVCRQHGEFTQSPLHHLSGQGCPKCGDIKRGRAPEAIMLAARRKCADVKIARHAPLFLAKSLAVHGDRYDYSQVVYRGKPYKVTIICRKHGPFEQSPWKHEHGKGCPVCSHHVSKGEDDVMTFVKSLGFEDAVRRDRQTIRPMELDIYIPSRKLAIEYCGMYWHSTATLTDVQARQKHVVKYRACEDQGVHLVTLYETEWESRRDAVEKTLAHLLGKSGRTVAARSCEIVAPAAAEASAFFKANHLQRAPASGVFVALKDETGIVACMAFSKGASQRGNTAEGHWELLRYATSCAVPGGASRLFQAFLRGHKPQSIVSFSDNRWFGGGMYQKLGFKLAEELKPDYMVWDQRFGCRHKSLYKRDEIPTRLREAKMGEVFVPETDPRTEWQMEDLLGAGRIYDCGKKRWLWTPSHALIS